MIIEIIDETEVVPESHQELVHNVVSFAADYLKIPENKECSISFISSERIREINREFRNIDKVTDVISFALDDSDDDFESMKSIMEEDDSFVTSIGDKAQAERRVSTLMGNKVEPRRKWIERHVEFGLEEDKSILESDVNAISTTASPKKEEKKPSVKKKEVTIDHVEQLSLLGEEE